MDPFAPYLSYAMFVLFAVMCTMAVLAVTIKVSRPMLKGIFWTAISSAFVLSIASSALHIWHFYYR